MRRNGRDRNADAWRAQIRRQRRFSNMSTTHIQAAESEIRFGLCLANGGCVVLPLV
jgi:hypothetical protein